MSLRNKYTDEEWNELEKKMINKGKEIIDIAFPKLDMPDIIHQLDPKKTEIISLITDKVSEKKANGKTPEVAIMSINDYNKFNEFTSSLTFYKCEYISNKNIIGALICGVRLIIHASINATDGEVEIY